MLNLDCMILVCDKIYDIDTLDAFVIAFPEFEQYTFKYRQYLRFKQYLINLFGQYNVQNPSIGLTKYSACALLNINATSCLLPKIIEQTIKSYETLDKFIKINITDGFVDGNTPLESLSFDNLCTLYRSYLKPISECDKYINNMEYILRYE